MGKILGDAVFTNSKIVSRKFISKGETKGMTSLKTRGVNENTTNVGLASNSEVNVDPTSDSDDGEAYPMKYSTSGDKSIGYAWQGEGIAQLDNAHGNDTKRSLNYGN